MRGGQFRERFLHGLLEWDVRAVRGREAQRGAGRVVEGPPGGLLAARLDGLGGGGDNLRPPRQGLQGLSGTIWDYRRRFMNSGNEVI